MALLRNRWLWRQSLLFKSWLKQLDSSRYLAQYVTFIYLLISVVWIVWSDAVLASLSSSAEALTRLQTFKGWFFVGCTGLMLYGLIRQGVERRRYNHRLLQSIINSTNDAIFVKDIQGRFLVVNTTAAHLLGSHPDEILGKKVDDFLPPQETQPMQWAEQEIFRTGQPQEIEQLLTIENQPRWFLAIQSLWLDDRSRPMGIVSITRDITRRKQAEAALRENEERLRLALTAANQGLYDINFQTGKAIVNSEYATMLGYDPADFHETNARWIERLHPDDREAVAQIYRAYIAGEISEYKAEFRSLTKTGEWKWILSLGKIVAWDEQGQPLRMMGTHTDISDRKQVEAELQRSQLLRGELRLLENILEIILAGYWDWDIPGNREYLSPTFKRMFGYEDHELPNLPETWQRLIFAEDLPRTMDSFERHIRTRGQSPFHNEVRYRHKDGSTIWVICSGRVIEWDAEGNPLRAIGCHINISDRKRVEEALQESERRFKAVFNQQFQFMAILNPDGTVIEVNQTCLKVTGMAIEQVLGCKFWETPWFNHLPQMQARWQEGIAAVTSGGTPVRGEVEYSLADGTTQFATYAITGLKDDRGQVVNIIFEGEGTDFTKRKRAEAELQHTNEQLAYANAELARATRLKDEFLASMSHELRTPLTAILGMSEMLERKIYGELNEKQLQYVEIISQSGIHLLKLINDILDLAKIETGKLELHVATTSVQALCSSSVSFVQQAAQEKNIKLETDIPPEIGMVQVDELRMRQALINLLSNAVKFTPAGGKVSLEAKRDRLQRVIQFNIVDTGIGIAPDDIPKLFQSFVQIDSSLSRQYDGTGLGLALVKQIVELHQGKVGVVSAVGQGSCFTITLPTYATCDLMPKANAKLAEVEPHLAGQPLQAHDAPFSKPLDQPLILLAEDNQANVDTFSYYLSSYGFRLVVATHGQEAVDLTFKHRPDLILMDIQMPGMNGLEAIAQIRADGAFAQVPIIALTALAMAGDREKCLAAGAVEYFAKPVSLRHLTLTIQSLLSGSRSRANA
ncbi:MAG: PAS domain S-box protein [Oscillatoriophycideae cyanobacterium NC_groundwater_1537_Pr4_S-0.65um_50_18]|nr:PAS domain S-box protein [Oscillatoriophycideae cyanobacterium NC_groundwater_1537_Pr4_S-0.65um_50_18]